LKYNPTDKTVLRLTGGRGYRATNVFTESSSLMASSRIVNIVEELKAEISWNYGISASHQFKLFGRQASVYTSFYRTDFENQVIVDLDADAQTANVYNLNGTSYSNSLQAEFGIEPVKRLQIKTAYKWNDVHMTTAGKLRRKSLVKQHKILTTFSYATNFNKWQFDLSTHVHGPARIPITAFSPSTQSPWHVTMNMQVTKRFKWFEMYIGAENLTNFRQKGAIIAANDPYGEFFDASLVWGATMGINPYLGLRYKLK
jgi:outer membrane receptor protein involved in Fe transport